MESLLALGCIVDKSPTTLRITSDPKERVAAAIFSALLGSACLLVILFVPLSRLSWSGVAVFGCVGVASLLFALSVWQCRTEIEFDLAQSLIVRRRFYLGKIWSTSVLPLDQLKTIKAVETETGNGELQLIQIDGKVWAKWGFLIEPLGEDIRREIMAWLRASSPAAEQ